MFFTLAKFAGFFLTLPNAAVFLVVVAAAGLWTPFARTFRILASASALSLAICAFSPIAFVVLRPLEDRFPLPKLAEAPTGVIVLGGSVNEIVTAARDAVALGDGAERVTEAVALSRRFPAMRLVFSGGSGRSAPGPISEAEAARRFWTEMGVVPDRMSFEDRSRDTWENAVFTREIVRPKPGETWLLITSAAHMPRSVGIFRQIGFAVVPYPVDYRTTGTSADYRRLRDAVENFEALAVASHEWIGLLAYRLTGKTDVLFPAP